MRYPLRRDEVAEKETKTPELYEYTGPWQRRLSMKTTEQKLQKSDILKRRHRFVLALTVNFDRASSFDEEVALCCRPCNSAI